MIVMFVGDSHGNTIYMRRVLDIAKETGVTLVIHVGDFGFWPGSVWTGKINKMFKRARVALWVIDGNHDWPEGFAMYVKPIDNIKPGLTTIPRGSVKTIGRTKIGFMGGAVSIDQSARTHGRSWWPSEMLTPEDVNTAIANGPVDIWVTHDAVEHPPVIQPRSFSPHLEQQLSMQRAMMRKVYDALKPPLHIHGHWHARYTSEAKYGRVIGLDYESDAGIFLMEIPDEDEGKTLRVHPCRVEGHGQFCEVGREAARTLSRSEEKQQWRSELDVDISEAVGSSHEEA